MRLPVYPRKYNPVFENLDRVTNLDLHRPVMTRGLQHRFDPAVFPVALLCTDPQRHMGGIVECFVLRWQIEVTFEEARRHLGIESQRQWSDKAIARTTPILLGLFSWVTWVAEQLNRSGHLITPRHTAWYDKTQPTFNDALASVRRQLWYYHQTFLMPSANHDMRKIPKRYLAILIDAVSFVA